MSYVAFENTYKDLCQCLDILEDGGPSSESEIRYAKRLIALCEEFAAFEIEVNKKLATLKKEQRATP